jgi:outer membrane protein OmpA-like peptidoglycan-associated protein
MSSKRLRSALTASAVLLVSLVGASSAYAQTTTPPTNPPDQQRETRSAKTTASGDTGLFFVPTAEVLPAKRFSFSLYRTNIDDGQGFTDVSNWPLTVGVGVGGRAEIFGAFNLMTRIDRDTRPLFFTATDPDGTGGGLLPNYPLNRETWVSDIGNTLLGIKFNLTSEADQKPAAFALRGTVNLPTGSKTHGTTTGKLDFGVDAILSKELGKVAELSGYAGYLMRGSPSGYELPNSVRYGAGIGFPTRKNFGLTVTAEAFGEFYSDKTLTAPAGLFGEDGSPVPTATLLKNPFVTALSATYEFPNGFFLGAGASWNMTMKSRNDTGVNCLTCKDHTLDEQGLNFRIGYHPGVRKYVAPPPPPPPPPPPAAAPPAPPAPHTLSVKASCNLCSVEVNKTDTVTATVTDSINCAVTYQWSAPSGSFTNGTARVTPWTAPGTPGSVPVTVKVTCPTDNMTASDTVNINVTQAVVKTYSFDDVYFDFDRSTLRPDALKILDGAVEAMKADSTLNLTIEGNTCNIGTAEYNLALGERRANVVRDYLTSQGIAASRLRTVSYGEEKPKYDNDREETRRLNRRAVLVVRLER